MERQPLTVSALTKYIKYLFDHDTNLQRVVVKGEVSNFTHHSRGHFYFTLKDEQAQIKAVMFRQQAETVLFQIEDGMQVIVEGYVTVYVAGGTYQIQVESVSVDGLGELFVRFEQLKKKLAAEGLFDERFKKPIPQFPKRIGVITSPTGAAIRDILTTLRRRYRLVEVIIFPTLVQGVLAKESIVHSIEKANAYPGLDVIILGRGGGSIEDLWCFNEEEVAYAIFKSKVPIISAVGHETDFTISDFVSDRRAATPTAAAELAVPNTQDLLVYLDQLKSRLSHAMNRLHNELRLRLNRIAESYVFKQPERILEQFYYRLDSLHKGLEFNSPKTVLSLVNERLMAYRKQLNDYYHALVRLKRHQFERLSEQLELVNPLGILKRGYAVVKKDNQVIQSVHQVTMGDRLTVDFNDGTLAVDVIEKEERTYE